MEGKITCVTVEDDELMSSILKDLIEEKQDLELLEQFTNGEVALNRINEIQPDLIFLDINMPGIDGLEMFDNLDFQTFVIIISGSKIRKEEGEEIPHVVAFLDKPVDHISFNKAISVAVKFVELDRNLS